MLLLVSLLFVLGCQDEWCRRERRRRREEGRTRIETERTRETNVMRGPGIEEGARNTPPFIHPSTKPTEQEHIANMSYHHKASSAHPS